MGWACRFLAYSSLYGEQPDDCLRHHVLGFLCSDHRLATWYHLQPPGSCSKRFCRYGMDFSG